MNEPTKICTKCGVEYPATKEFFYAHKECKFGLSGQCKKCRYIINKEWFKNNTDKIKNYDKRWREQNPEKVKEKNKKQYWANPEKYKEYAKIFRKENPEKIRGWAKRWQKENPEKVKENRRKHYKLYTEKIIESTTKWQQANPGKVVYIKIKHAVKKQIGATPPPELVEIKVLINKTKKLCKTLNS